jgi:hypothetical protein
MIIRSRGAGIVFISVEGKYDNTIRPLTVHGARGKKLPSKGGRKFISCSQILFSFTTKTMMVAEAKVSDKSRGREETERNENNNNSASHESESERRKE